MSTSRVQLLRDFTAIDDSVWGAVLSESATQTVFQSLAWMQSWWEVFGRGKLLLIAAYENDQLMAVAPLFSDHGMVFFIGSGGSDYLDFLGAVHQPKLLRMILELARAETSGFVGFRFYHVPDRSPTYRSLRSAAAALDLEFFDEGSQVAPALRFKDWPADKRPPAEKKSLVRHVRAFEKVGRLEVEHFCDSSQVHAMLPVFYRQHIARWSVTPNPSLFEDQQQCEFYNRLVDSFGSRGWLRFSRVSLDDQAIAFHFGFLFEGSFLWYKPSFEIQRARQSPGEVLLRSLLIHAQRENAQVFDFGLGDEPFKQRFATETRVVCTVGLYPSQKCD